MMQFIFCIFLMKKKVRLPSTLCPLLKGVTLCCSWPSGSGPPNLKSLPTTDLAHSIFITTQFLMLPFKAYERSHMIALSHCFSILCLYSLEFYTGLLILPPFIYRVCSASFCWLYQCEGSFVHLFKPESFLWSFLLFQSHIYQVYPVCTSICL